MAGSRKWFVYTADDGTLHGVNLDEGNTEQVNGGTNDVPDAATVKYSLPRNVKPRRLIYKSLDGRRTIRIVALTPTIYQQAELNAGSILDPIDDNQNLILYGKEPERITVIRGVDSGLNDGDAS